MGGVTTEAEQQRMEAIYRQRLEQVRNSMEQTIAEVKRLESLKNKFMDLATPVGAKVKLPSKDDAKGGPFVSPVFKNGFFHLPLHTELQQTANDLDDVVAKLGHYEKQWQDHLSWLEALPIGFPIQADFRLTSGFGIRNDPFTGALAMHEGLDFSAEVGTPVLATAPGVVIRSEWDNGYGNVIEIKHAENFLTRYAHLSKRFVTENSTVQNGTHIGNVGSTGRSTGPHLHYEIFQNGRVLNPMQVLPVKPLNN